MPEAPMPRPAPFDTIPQNAFGLGGQNTCMVLRRWAE